LARAAQNQGSAIAAQRHLRKQRGGVSRRKCGQRQSRAGGWRKRSVGSESGVASLQPVAMKRGINGRRNRRQLKSAKKLSAEAGSNHILRPSAKGWLSIMARLYQRQYRGWRPGKSGLVQSAAANAYRLAACRRLAKAQSMAKMVAK